MARARRVGVLTFHRCINYGSYWQARALTEGLRRKGHDAVLLDHHSAQVSRAELRNAFRPTLPQRTPRADYRLYGRKTRKFLEACARLPLSRPFPLDRPEAMEPCEVVVVGSDEVWNFRHPWYAACPLFFGDGVRAERLVAYAASFGCHDADERLDPWWAERLRRFEALAVRDENSRRLLRDGLGQEPALVLDPCLQFDEVCRRAGAGTSATLVVYGHNFPAAVVEQVVAWARARGLRTVSLGYRNDWADEQRLDAGPEEFADAFGAAEAVVTNFFHGCVFSLLNDKPFVCTPTQYRWHKIAALVEAAGAAHRLVDEASPAERIAAALEEPPGEFTRSRLGALRAQSSAYLDHALQ